MNLILALCMKNCLSRAFALFTDVLGSSVICAVLDDWFLRVFLPSTVQYTNTNSTPSVK